MGGMGDPCPLFFMRTHDIEQPAKYDFWVIPEFPIHIPWVRDREIKPGEEWRLGLLEDIRKNGLKNHIGVYGHFARTPINPAFITPNNANRDMRYAVCLGTNRLWCLVELGYKTFPGILSLPKDQKPEWDGYKIQAIELPEYFTDGNIWVKRYAFGLTKAADPRITYATGKPAPPQPRRVILQSNQPPR